MHNRGILVLLNIIAQGATQRTGAAETAKYALDSLEVATLVPTTLTETCLVEAGDNKTGKDGFIYVHSYVHTDIDKYRHI